MAEGFRAEYLKMLESGKLYERDLLKIILGNANGGKDMSATADALLARFPGIMAIIEADYREITAVDGVTDSVACYLKSLDRAYKICNSEELQIGSTAQCFEVIERRFRGKDSECVELYFVNKSGTVTDIKHYSTDNADKVEISANLLLSEISSSRAYGLYFAHNHVNCPATPSEDDDRVTMKIISACKMCGIKFFDHCIISSTGDKFSYLKSGKMTELENRIN